MEIPMVEVPKAKYEALVGDSAYLQQIREASEEVEAAHQEYLYAKDKSLEKKKAYDTLQADLHRLIEEGPPKPGPQPRLPFEADEEAEVAAEKASGKRGEVVGSNDLDMDDEDDKTAKKAAAVPPEIEALDLTPRQKQMLAETGAETLADLVDLANANWKNYPKGLASIKGLGSAAIAKLVKQLPSTAPARAAQPGELPPETKRIRLQTFAAGNDLMQEGDEYDATVRDDGVAIVVLPGQEPVEFQVYEYELVS